MHKLYIYICLGKGKNTDKLSNTHLNTFFPKYVVLLSFSIRYCHMEYAQISSFQHWWHSGILSWDFAVGGNGDGFIALLLWFVLAFKCLFVFVLS